MEQPITTEQIRSFRRHVYRYFSRYGRVLPWRTNYDPYHILVSEIMLQQTQVDRVIGKFTTFIDQFPTIQTLADAPLDSVLTAWQGLGYNRRAVSLRKAARHIIEAFNATIPNTPEALRTLPGIGTATAASIAAFAFNTPTIFLETNIRTVYIYHFLNNQQPVSDSEILPLATEALDLKNPRKWYSALMDYGTMLKKEVGNLTRNSVTYKKQSPFAGSQRELRGAIIRAMTTMNEATAAVLSRAISRDITATTEQLDKLVSEGTLQKEKRRYRIAP